MFTGMIVDARIKNRTVAEVEEQGNHAMRIIAQTIRNSTAINLPVTGAVGPTLGVQSIDPLLNPAIFDLSGSTLRIKEGAGSPVDLTNSHVAVSSLSFENLSWPATPGIIRVSFIISYLNPQGRNEYDFSKTWSTSISLRGD